MILIDPRTGSKELEPQFRSLGIPVEISQEEIPAGDFCFEGLGPNGSKFLIGIERKSIKDLMTSIRSGRLGGHQVIEMAQMYQRSYLIIEGVFSYDRDSGLLMEPANGGKWRPIETGTIRYMYSELYKFQLSLMEFSNMKVLYSSNKYMTAVNVVMVYKMWNDKPYEAHKSVGGQYREPRIEIGKWSFPRRVAAELKGVQESSSSITRHFGSVRRMANASAEEWEKVEIPRGKSVRKVGKKMAQEIFNQFREGE